MLLILSLFICFSLGTSLIYDPSVSLIINKTLTYDGGDDYYAVAICLASEIVYNTLAFDPSIQSSKNPRIFTVSKFTQVNSLLGTVEIPPIEFFELNNVTFHYFSLTLGTASTQSVATVAEAIYDFPTLGTVFSAAADSYAGLSFGYNYHSHVYTKFIEHLNDNDVYCQVAVVGTRIMRAIYFNDQFFADFALSADYPTVSTTDGTATLKNVLFPASQMTMITMVGFRLKVTSVTISDCKETVDGTVIAVAFSYYYNKNSVSSVAAASENRIVNPQITLGTCPAGSTRCYSSSRPTICPYPKFWKLYSCVDSCSDSVPFFLSTRLTCQQGILSGAGVRYSVTTTNSLLLDAFFYFDTPKTVRKIIYVFPFTNRVDSVFQVWEAPTVVRVGAEGSLFIGIVDQSNQLMRVQSTIKLFTSYSSVLIYGYDLYEDRARSLNMVIYPTSDVPPLQWDRGVFTKAYYAKHDEINTWDSAKFARATTTVECNSTCQITFYATGQVQVYKNHHTLLASVDLRPTPSNYTIQKVFSAGTFLLDFYLTGGGVFAAYIEGENSRMYGMGPVILPFGVGGLSGSGSPTPGYNCVDGNCLSCYSPKLQEGTSCVDSCSGGDVELTTERRCVSACDQPMLLASAGECVQPCAESGKFYISGSGCTGDCMPGCISCTNATSCLECNPEVEMNLADQCITDSYIKIVGSPVISSCIDLILFAEINPNEEQKAETPFEFIWYVESNSSTDPTESALNDLFSTHTTKELRIPSSYLEPGIEYTFECLYTNKFGFDISDTFVTSTTSGLIPTVMMDGGLTQNIKRFKNNVIQVQAYYSSCVEMDKPFDVDWSHMGGDLITIEDYTVDELPLWLVIPSCSLPYDSTYHVKAKVSIHGFSDFFAEVMTAIKIGPEVFSAQINYGNRAQPYNKPIELNGVILYEGVCDDTDSSSVTFTWSCRKAVNTGSSFKACSDPEDLFGVANASSSLVVPLSYFNKGQILEFTLTVAKGVKTASTTSKITIQGPSTLIVELKCTSESEYACIKIGSNSDYIFEANIEDLEYDPNLIFTWTTEPPLEIATFQNLMKILEDPGIELDNIKVSVTLSTKAQNGGAYIEVPVNKPPKDGAISISPTSGESLSTYFYVSASNWADDGDYPLRYQFFFNSIDSEDESSWKPLTGIQKLSYTYTYFPAETPKQTIYVRVKVYDTLGLEAIATTSLEVTVSESNIEQSIMKLEDMMNLISKSNNPYENARLSLLVSTEFANWESVLTSKTDNCPSCSGKGSCNQYDVCVCTNGWTLPDCSLKQIAFDKVIALKEEAIKIAQESYEKTKTEEMKNILLATLESSSDSSSFNTKETLLKIQEILDKTLADSLLTEEQSQIVTNIVSNLIEFAGTDDCNCTTEFCQNLESKTQEYLETVSSSTLNDKMPGEKPVVLESDLFDVATVKTTPCDISSLQISLSSNAPELSFINQRDPSTMNCSEELLVQVYAFKDRRQIFGCSGTPAVEDFKNVISTTIKNTSSGLDVIKDIFVSIDIPEVIPCLKECSPDAVNNCICPLLDVKTQMSKIFLESDLGTLKNISALRDWNLQTSPVFWTNVGLFGAFAASSLAVTSTSLKSYCAVANFEHAQHKSWFSTLLLCFLIANPLLNVLFIKTSHVPKSSRALLYYLRLILYATFTTLFSKAGSNQGIVNLILTTQFYLALLPYISIVPINACLTRLITPTNLSIAAEKKEKQKHNRMVLIRRVLTNMLVFILTGLFILSMFIIAANKSLGAQQRWLEYLLFFIIQDLIIIPILNVSFQLILHKVNKTSWMLLNPPLHYHSIQFIDKDMAKVIEKKKASTKIHPIKTEYDSIANAKAVTQLEVISEPRISSPKGSQDNSPFLRNNIE